MILVVCSAYHKTAVGLSRHLIPARAPLITVICTIADVVLCMFASQDAFGMRLKLPGCMRFSTGAHAQRLELLQ